MTYISNQDYWITRAIKNIEANYGDIVSVDSKNKSLIKYGVNGDIDSGITETVWQVGGHETYPTSNSINEVVSTSGSDTQSVVIEGHTLSGSDLTFVTQTVTLTGITAVTLSTPLYRANRMYNNGSTDFVGTITVEDTVAGTTHLSCAAGTINQSLKCATSLSSTDYWIVTALDISVKKSGTGASDFEFQVREYGKVWRTRYYISSHSYAGGKLFPLEPCIIVPKNADIRMIATSGVNNLSCSASIHGVLATIV